MYNEIKKVNSVVNKKQIGRLIIGVSGLVIGSICMTKYAVQHGITTGQKHISEMFPEEYKLMTEKVENVLKK